MDFHIFTIFPEMISAPVNTGIIGRSQSAGVFKLHVHHIRDFANDRHKTVDDSPFAGGPGMVMGPGPIFQAVESVSLPDQAPIILLSPQGKLFDQKKAEQLAKKPAIALICGRYEGVDERVSQYLATEELSIGDYVLTGGELAAMVILESVVRLLPGTLGHGPEAIQDDTHTSGLIQHPQYTRPAEFRTWKVPEILLSGNHTEIARWRRKQSLRRTLERRPDLLEQADLSLEDQTMIQGMSEETQKTQKGS